MKITMLVDDKKESIYQETHGLSLYIKTKKHNILFDLGPDDTFIKNAKKANILLEDVDIVIISHGHNDHGGGLEDFLKINKTAKIYIQEKAFEKHYSNNKYIGLNKNLIGNKQIILLRGNIQIDDELYLFKIDDKSIHLLNTNDNLFDDYGKDQFSHEQNLFITENKNVLFVGCGHSGIGNIFNYLQNENIDFCIGGFHTYSPRIKKSVDQKTLEIIVNYLKKYPCIFYTCHCTGDEAYDYFKNNDLKIQYFATGNSLKI